MGAMAPSAAPDLDCQPFGGTLDIAYLRASQLASIGGFVCVGTSLAAHSLPSRPRLPKEKAHAVVEGKWIVYMQHDIDSAINFRASYALKASQGCQIV